MVNMLTSASSTVPACGFHWTAPRGKKWCIRIRSLSHGVLIEDQEWSKLGLPNR